jgi:hypothetical protein
MSSAHHIETVLSEDGKLSLDHLPFHAGHAVEVIVLPRIIGGAPDPGLRGVVLRFDRPTEPVAEGGWGVSRGS